jgi:hypothetical protein
LVTKSAEFILPFLFAEFDAILFSKWLKIKLCDAGLFVSTKDILNKAFHA